MVEPDGGGSAISQDFCNSQPLSDQKIKSNRMNTVINRTATPNDEDLLDENKSQTIDVELKVLDYDSNS